MNLRLTWLIAIIIPTISANSQYFEGPGDRSVETFETWFEEFNDFIRNASTNLDFSMYDNEAVKWARTSFVQPQLMLHDR